MEKPNIKTKNKRKHRQKLQRNYGERNYRKENHADK